MFLSMRMSTQSHWIPICLFSLQKESGLYAPRCGMSLKMLSAAQLLGYSTTSMTPNGLLSYKDPLDDNDKEKKTLTNTNLSEAEEYFTSTEWSQRVDHMLNSYVAIPVPSHTNQSNNNCFSISVQKTPCISRISPHVLIPIMVPPNHHGNATFWSLSRSIF